tara:strand:+ start:339 stop:497 length:159 start_codon:yes stop_codon:yes gene_type:complete
MKRYEIDFDKVKSLKDVIDILKDLNIQMELDEKEEPNKFKLLRKKGMLKEIV